MTPRQLGAGALCLAAFAALPACVEEAPGDGSGSDGSVEAGNANGGSNTSGDGGDGDSGVASDASAENDGSSGRGAATCDRLDECCSSLTLPGDQYACSTSVNLYGSCELAYTAFQCDRVLGVGDPGDAGSDAGADATSESDAQVVDSGDADVGDCTQYTQLQSSFGSRVRALADERADCAYDDECVLHEPEPYSCAGVDFDLFPGPSYSIAALEQAAFDTAYVAIGAEECPAAIDFYTGCGYAGSPPATVAPGCVAGTCTGITPGSDEGTPRPCSGNGPQTGDRILRNAVDLSRFRCATSLDGNLRVELVGGRTDVGTLSLPNLTSVSGNLVVAAAADSDLTSLSLAGLTSIGGELSIDSHPTLVSFTAPLLEAVSSVNVTGNLLLETFETAVFSGPSTACFQSNPGIGRCEIHTLLGGNDCSCGLNGCIGNDDAGWPACSGWTSDCAEGIDCEYDTVAYDYLCTGESLPECNPRGPFGGDGCAEGSSCHSGQCRTACTPAPI